MRCSAMSCNHFTCGGIGHHKDCVRYPESMQEMIDSKNERIKKLEAGLEKLISQCEQVDSWESFPSSWVDDAHNLVTQK